MVDSSLVRIEVHASGAGSAVVRVRNGSAGTIALGAAPLAGVRVSAAGGGWRAAARMEPLPGPAIALGPGESADLPLEWAELVRRAEPPPDGALLIQVAVRVDGEVLLSPSRRI